MHGEVFGVPGVKWEQAGRLYDTTGRQVTIQNDMAVPVAVPEKIAAPEDEGLMSDSEVREFARINGISGWKTKSLAQLREEMAG
jgi:hypothetical protein